MTQTQDTFTISEYTVRVERSFSALSVTPEQWDALLEESISPYIFLRYWWLYCWVKAFQADDKIFIITIHRNDQVIGIAPLMIERLWYCGISCRALQFLATAEGDYLDLICREIDLPYIAGCVVQTIARLRDEWDIVQLSNIVEHSPSVPALTAAFAEQHYVQNTTMLEDCHQIVIAGDITAYIAGRPNKRTNVTIGKNIRRFEQLGSVKFDHIENTTNVEPYLDRLFTALKERDKQMERLGLEGDYLRYRRFFSELCHTEQIQRYVRFFVMTVDGEPVDYEFSFMDDRMYYSYKGCFEIAYGKYSVGNVRRMKLYEYVREHGLQSIDFLRGSEEYKKYWTDQQHSIVALEARPRYGWGMIASCWHAFVTTYLRRFGVLLTIHRWLRRRADKIACKK